MTKYKKARTRVVIENVAPALDAGLFPVKRIIGDRVVVEADIYADGHDVLSAVLLYRRESSRGWTEAPMKLLVNDRWSGSFTVNRVGRYRYTFVAWVDTFQTWRHNIGKKVEVGQDVSVDLLEGARLIEEASRRADERTIRYLKECLVSLRSRRKKQAAKVKLAMSKKTTAAMARYSDRTNAATYPQELSIVVDREKARFSTWYEMFPRSCADEAGKHGTFKDCERRLPYISEMGFDVLYLPPIHPIGHTNRKGKNNSTTARPDDPGTPWAIGSEEGGHKAVHPRLGTLDDFKRFITKAGEYGIEVALDIAFQCSPDHPYVKEHPKWFRWRPDGTVQYAENPPKKYQDIYPLEFETEHWRELWEELKSVLFFWIKQGVRIFRVDNPHTKPFTFWEWLIGEIKNKYPEVILFAEAFTRPKIMYRLAQLGFSQSYTYFTWRNVKWELTQYFTELTQTEVREFFRPNLWPNTPDILTDYLRDGGRPAFIVRLVLAATLGASYGIYGPAFELCENRRRDTTSEEYLDSEKYEIKHWNITHPDSLKGLISRINTIRRENPALQGDLSLRFHSTDNENLICYSKRNEDKSNVILVVVNLDSHYRQSGWVGLAMEELGLDSNRPFQVYDLLNDARYTWRGPRNYVELSPEKAPAHIFRIDRKSEI